MDLYEDSEPQYESLEEYDKLAAIAVPVLINCAKACRWNVHAVYCEPTQYIFLVFLSSFK
jgi:hypothetical protein